MKHHLDYDRLTSILQTIFELDLYKDASAEVGRSVGKVNI